MKPQNTIILMIGTPQKGTPNCRKSTKFSFWELLGDLQVGHRRSFALSSLAADVPTSLRLKVYRGYIKVIVGIY